MQSFTLDVTRVCKAQRIMVQLPSAADCHDCLLLCGCGAVTFSKKPLELGISRHCAVRGLWLHTLSLTAASHSVIHLVRTSDAISCGCLRAAAGLFMTVWGIVAIEGQAQAQVIFV